MVTPNFLKEPNLMTVNEPLSYREEEVVALLLQGKSNKQIAITLGITTRTVEFHISHIYEKTGVSSRAEAIIKLSEKQLRKTVDQAENRQLRETTVENLREPSENDAKPIISIRRITMKKLFLYVMAIGSIGCIGLIVLILLYNFFLPGKAGQTANSKLLTSPTTTVIQPSHTTSTQTVTRTDIIPTIASTPTSALIATIPLPTQMLPHTYAVGAMTYDRERGEAVLFGGQQLWKCEYCDETWIWDPTTWRMVEPINKPQGRNGGFRLAYDDNRKVSVLFGGTIVKPDGSQIASDDTWVWNGADWIIQNIPTTPGVHLSPLMVYDASRKNILLYGGNQPQGKAIHPLTDTWVWNGVAWVEKKPSTNPGPASLLSAGIAYDAAREVVVLWNGSTWTWNGADWVKQNTSHTPSFMNGIVMGYDEAHQQTVLVGRTVTSEPGQEKTETWLWDGVDWTFVSDNFLVNDASGENMIYDSKHNTLILFTLCGDKFLGKTRTALAWTGKSWEKLYEAPADPVGTQPNSNQ